MLHALVLPDRAAEHDSVARIFGRAVQRVAAESDRLRAHQHALGIQTVEDVAETLAFLADPVVLGDEQAIDEDGVGIDRVAAHFADAAHLDLFAVEVGVEQGHALRRALAVFLGRGAGQQQDLIGDLGGRGPHLAALHDITALHAGSESRDAGRVEPGVRLGDAEASLLFAFDERREPIRLLFGRAMHDDRMRPKQVDVDR